MKFFRVSFPLISIIILIWIEQGLEFPYTLKTLAKAILLLAIPIVLFYKSKFPYLQFKKIDVKSMRVAISAGIAIMFSIIGAFLLLQTFIDTEALVLDLAEKGVTPKVFPLIALYILFGNSLMEEFFFRGLLPSLFKGSKLRFVLPSLFFSIYHIAIFLPWFNLPLLLVAIAGLWIGGSIFQLANERSGTILPSWTIHMFADIGVLIVGVYILYF